jgi:hypothetical protein
VIEHTSLCNSAAFRLRSREKEREREREGCLRYALNVEAVDWAIVQQRTSDGQTVQPAVRGGLPDDRFLYFTCHAFPPSIYPFEKFKSDLNIHLI